MRFSDYENEVAGFAVVLQYLLTGYFRLCQVNVSDCPAGLGNRPPRRVREAGEKLL